jgi:hypothetical protein
MSDPELGQLLGSAKFAAVDIPYDKYGFIKQQNSGCSVCGVRAAQQPQASTEKDK